MKLCFFLILFSAARASAEPDLSLQQAVQEALASHPQMAVANGRVQEAAGQRVQAGLRPNPRLTLQSEDLRPPENGAPFSYANSTEEYFLLGQIIESGGKRGRRLDVANAAVATSEVEAQLTRRRIVAQVSSSYWLAVSAQRVSELSAQNLRTYDEDVTYSSNRVKEGVQAEADLIRIQIERDRVRAAALVATRDADQALVALYRAMGRSNFAPAHLTGSLEDAGTVTLPDLARVLALRPEIRIGESAVQQAKADYRLQKANGKPDPEAFVGYKRNIGLDTAYAALQIDLPIANRNQGNVASAAARIHEAEAQLRLTRLSVQADVEAAQRAYIDEKTVLERLPETERQAEESERLTRAAYREGALDLLRLLDAQRSRIQVQVEYYRALADLQQSILNLQVASGEPLRGEQ